MSQLLAGVVALTALIIWIAATVKIRGAHDPEYCKLYALTDDFAKEVGLRGPAGEKVQEGQKRPRKPRTTAWKSWRSRTMRARLPREEPSDDGTRVAG